MAESAAIIAAMADATKASGTLVRVEPAEFAKIIGKSKAPLVVYAEGGVLQTNHQYLTSYKGLAFYTKSGQQLSLPIDAEVVVAEKIWIPG
jgi:hypothetical protein